MLLKIVKESNGKRPKVREKNPASFHEAEKKNSKGRNDCVSTWHRRKALPAGKEIDWKENICIELESRVNVLQKEVTHTEASVNFLKILR